MRQSKFRFVTLFPNCPNVGLVKDVGQIPYVLSKKYENIESTLVTYCVDLEGAGISNVQGLNLVKCPRILGNVFISGVAYLILHAKEMDWLNIYHARRRSYLWAKLFKLLNPKGKVYLKLDIGFIECDLLEENIRKRKTFNKIIGIMDLVTVESKAVLKRLQKFSNCDIRLISNGFCDTHMQIDIDTKREDTFITVGRLGTLPKATDLLLEGFKQSAASHTWRLKLIGPVEPEFKAVVREFFENNPELQSRVQFLGQISDKNELYKEYCKAKVFVLPSRWEGFPLVLPEALMCGCHTLVSSMVPPSEEMTCDGRFGKVFLSEDVEQLKKKLIMATQEEYSKEDAKEISAYAREYFSWDKICEQLYEYLCE